MCVRACVRACVSVKERERKTIIDLFLVCFLFVCIVVCVAFYSCCVLEEYCFVRWDTDVIIKSLTWCHKVMIDR